MTKPDQDLNIASAAVAAAFEWDRLDAPYTIRRSAQAVLRARSVGTIIAAGYDLAERVSEATWLRLEPRYLTALETTNEFALHVGFELELALYTAYETQPDH